MASWMNTDARNKVACPKCGQQQGDPCRTPKGRKVLEPHVERLIALRAHSDYNIEHYMIRGGV